MLKYLKNNNMFLKDEIYYKNNLLPFFNKYSIFKKKIIIIFFLLICILIIYNIKYTIKLIESRDTMKVCLCTIGKNENKYAREYVEHYKNYGVDKIFIYDNNDLDGELFENVISDYISSNLVKIINFRGFQHPQIKMLNHCYKNNSHKYDWFIMFDMDEFINLKFYKNIKNYLNNKKFNKCTAIYFYRAFHTDNNQLYYINKSLAERFPESVYNVFTVKPIFRGHISNVIIDNNHLINAYYAQYESCYGFGQRKKNKKKMDFKYYYIDHYYFKSTEEFIVKIKNDVYYNNTYGLKMIKIDYYFECNLITLEKINLIENKTGINLTKYKNKLLKK